MLRGYVETLLALTPLDWERVAFFREPQSRRLTGEQRHSLFSKAQDCGRREAAGLRERYGSLPVERLAALCGGRVLETFTPPDPQYALFASFEEPDLITVNMAAVREGERLMEEFELTPLLGRVDLRELLLGHELFHLLMSRLDDVFIKKRHVVAFQMGPLRLTRRVACLEEIAAMAFSSELLGLRCPPYIFNVVMLYAFHPQMAGRLLADYSRPAPKPVHDGFQNRSARKEG